MQTVAIIALCIGSAVVYGIVHDQVTARVCVEYPPSAIRRIFGTDSPTLLGIGWGIIATWWVGLLLGIPWPSPPERDDDPSAMCDRWCGRSSRSSRSWASAPCWPGSPASSWRIGAIDLVEDLASRGSPTTGTSGSWPTAGHTWRAISSVSSAASS